MFSASDRQQQSQSSIGLSNTDGTAAFVMPFERGELVAGKYKAIDLIGVGGIGFVVSARHVRLDELVALKFLRPEFATNEEAVRRFEIEARASFKINSDHVVRVLDVDSLPDGTPFIVMELLEGIDLGRMLAARGPLPPELAVRYALQACHALSAAHACYVVHRDIKPENLFATGSGPAPEHIKVLDFGISKIVLGGTLSPGQTQKLAPVGSPAYMSPEQVRAADEIDARTDIWSLGCVLYELLTGSAPFERSTVSGTCAAVIEDELAPLRSKQPNLPAELEAVIERCLRKEPAQRFQDAAELALALAPFAPEPTAMNTQPLPATPAEPAAPVRRRPWVLPLLLAFTVIGASTAVVHVLGTRPPAVAPSSAQRAASAPRPAASVRAPAPAAPNESRAPAAATPPAVHKTAPVKPRATAAARRTSDEPDVGF